jgi:hypothetical protein
MTREGAESRWAPRTIPETIAPNQRDRARSGIVSEKKVLSYYKTAENLGLWARRTNRIPDETKGALESGGRPRWKRG